MDFTQPKQRKKEMHETKQQVTARKIRNGLRKQAEKVWAEKMEVWDELKRDPSSTETTFHIDNDVNSYYMWHVPVLRNSVIDWETTA